MKIEEAIVYVLSTAGRGMRTEQIAKEINDRQLFILRMHSVEGKKPLS